MSENKKEPRRQATAYGKEVGSRIKAILEKRGISQRRMAADLHVGKSLIGQYLSGQTLPPSDKIVMIAEYLGVSTDDLLLPPKDTGKENKNSALLQVIDFCRELMTE